MNEPGSFKRVINYPGWAIAAMAAAGVAEIAVKFVLPLLPRLI